MDKVYYVLCSIWPVLMAGLAIAGMGILMFVISQRFFYFKRRVKSKDYRIKDSTLDRLDLEDLNKKEQSLL